MTDKSRSDNSSRSCISDPVCINACRIYDSCADKDCAENLPVFFTQPVQMKIDSATGIRFAGADIITVYINNEPVPFHKGFYTVEMTFFLEISIDVFSVPNMRPENVSGLSIFSKKAVLYGGEGSVKVFSSDNDQCIPDDIHQSLPKTTVQTAPPVPLDAKLNKGQQGVLPCCQIPDTICKRYGGSFMTGDRANTVSVTVGLFTIVQMERYSQMLIPSFDCTIPERECSPSSDTPCEMFEKLDFPLEAFFPQEIT